MSHRKKTVTYNSGGIELKRIECLAKDKGEPDDYTYVRAKEMHTGKKRWQQITNTKNKPGLIAKSGKITPDNLKPLKIGTTAPDNCPRRSRFRYTKEIGCLTCPYARLVAEGPEGEEISMDKFSLAALLSMREEAIELLNYLSFLEPPNS